ncbi:hypothetical protein HWV62_12388 [Athelia sp. TMB]|nr:hypothetical protein HWV62_12388 [Athelia sp. TMB]
MASKLKSIAYASGNSELVTVKGSLVYIKPGKATPTMVDSIMETITNIPARIGATSLKEILFIALIPGISKWSKGYPNLTLRDVTLRHKNWAQILPLDQMVPGTSDIDAISERFYPFKKASKNTKEGRYFKTGEITLYLALDYPKYQAILMHIEEREFEDEQADSTTIAKGKERELDLMLGIKTADGNHVTGHGGTAFERQNQSGGYLLPQPPVQMPFQPITSVSNCPQTTTPRKKRTYSQVTSPSGTSPNAKRVNSTTYSPNSVKQALMKQKGPSVKAVQSILNTKRIRCLVYIVAPCSFESLITNAKTYSVKHEAQTFTCDLIYDPMGQSKFGGFKRATFGHTSVPIFGSSAGSKVCIKQAFYTKKGAPKIRYMYDSAAQMNHLTRDINCSRWADASMQLVYNLVDETRAQQGGQPPLEVPRLRFVKMALAIAENDDHDTYLLEEVIDEKQDGPFLKYINNNSAVPVPLVSPDRAYIAKFLSFAQHVQFTKTGYMRTHSAH